MSCELVGRDLDAYLDRELDAESSAALREHVMACAACRRQLAQREALTKLVRGAPYYSAPDRLRAADLQGRRPGRGRGIPGEHRRPGGRGRGR